MATDYNVVLYELSRKVEELNVLAEQLQNEISALEDIECRLSGMWEGESRTLFHEYFIRDVYQMRYFPQVLVRYAERLQNVQARYATAEMATMEIPRIHLV